MQNTTPAFALESIDNAALLFVSGGCHKRCCGQQQQTIINNMPPAPAPQILPQAAPQPQVAPSDPTAAAAAGPTGDIVTTNVSINGQPVGR